MKTFRLLIVSLLLATSASAQHHRGERRGGDYSPTVYLISVHEVDTIYNCGGCAAQQSCGTQPHGRRQRHAGLHRHAPPRLPADRGSPSSCSPRRTTVSRSR
ncbi:MAG: hypothetical protein ACLUQ6_03695 [Alistipes onderdonkii]